MPHPNAEVRPRLSRALKAEALRLGFDDCGISWAGPLDKESDRLQEWLQAGRNGTMSWMERNGNMRIDPTILVEGARSIVSVLHNYYHPLEASEDPEIGRISRYAWGDDYHDVMKRKLRKLLDWLSREAGGVSGRVFVDSAPFMDRAWAARSGLGWVGKHTNLINTSIGSYFFIGEMVVDVELEADAPIADHCGSCTKCIDACPTDSIIQPYVLDATRCISYLTIEHRENDVSEELREGLGNWVFGCDICQDVCPWNKFRKPSSESDYKPRPGTIGTPLSNWASMDHDEFSQRFSKSPVKRARWEGFMRNVRNAAENVPGGDDNTPDADPSSLPSRPAEG